MLAALSIRNLAVVESAQIMFDRGFQVLTGETGAGKSIIIDALSLAIGGRGSAELVRHGCDKAEIEACFEMEEDHPVWQVIEQLGIAAEKDEQLLIRREVSVSGKSTSRINGQMVNLTMLREVGEWLVNIHGQHEHQSLLKVDHHIKWLDLYGEAEIFAIKQDYTRTYEEFTAVRKQLAELNETSMQALQMQDLYRFQIEEIAAAKLIIGEDECLAEEKRKLANAEKLFQNVAESYELLSGGRGLDSLRKAQQRLQDIGAFDSKALQPLIQQMEEAYYQLEDVSFQLRDYKDGIEFNPERLEQIERRLDELSMLRRKYGNGTLEILDYLQRITMELETIENKDELVSKLEQRMKELAGDLARLAEKLSTARKQASVQLATEIENELRDLQMEKTKFQVSIDRLADGEHGLESDGAKWKFGRDGWDQVEFLISANPGEPLRSLSKTASGGELSRIMLALKAIFAKVDRIPSLVFDEVDTGVSGRAAEAIANKLAVLSRSCQVFSITHLPQVASMADTHFCIGKVVEGDRTRTQVEKLSDKRRSEELARMLGGAEVTETALSHAQQLLTMATARKSN
ncbi:MAG: recombination protein RecN [Paenibacillaceae bacterium]|nr:recombination protein RecN [Paenibacillaceae bacterium]